MTRKTLALIFCVLALTGCNMELREADMLTIVSGVAIDKDGDDYALTIEIARPDQTGVGYKSVPFVSRGSTLHAAMKESINLTGRRLYFTHADIAVLGRETAENGVQQILDAIIRQNELPLTVRMMVSESAAGEILSAEPVMDAIISREIRQVLTSNSELSEVPDVTLCRFAARVLESGVDGFLPLVRLAQSGEGRTQQVQGAALFAGDKLACVIDKELTQCLLWSSGATKMGVLSQDGNAFSVSNVRTGIEASVSGAVIKMSMDIFRSEGSLSEAESVRYVNEIIENRMEQLLAATRQNGCDPIGFGREIKRRDLQSWKTIEASWAEHYRDYKIDLELNVKYVTSGRTQ